MKRALILVLIVIIYTLGSNQTYAAGQRVTIRWEDQFNISNTPSKTSTDPFLLSDPAGIGHFFWAEKVADTPGNQADTIMYSSWNKQVWLKPVDIFFSPLSDGNPIISYPNASLDMSGMIHLIWMSQPNFPNYALNYSSVPADLAGKPSSWNPPVYLAKDLTGTKYSSDLEIGEDQILHVVYARVQISERPPEDRAVTYIQSRDGGVTWSQPVDIYSTNDPLRGASDTRLLLEAPDRVYVSWTEWDESGNGQVIYFARSIDNGLTWQSPIALDVTAGLEYERDWNNMALLGDGQIVSIWEGGWRAYRHAMYSSDGGQTWTEPVDVFPWLIGDNGFVEFTLDGAGQVHAFVASRIREGITNRKDRFGLWHSVWEGGGRWSEAVYASVLGGEEGMTNPKVAIIGGNRIVAAWYGSSIYEMMVMTGTIEGVPEIPASPRNVGSNVNLLTPLITDEPMVVQEAVPTPSEIITPVSIATENVEQGSTQIQRTLILVSVVGVGLLLVLYLLFRYLRSE